MTRILGVVGSPRRRGNTELLVQAALAGAAAAGAEVECVRLGELQVRGCDGCHACWRGRPCSKADDGNDLFPRLAASDGLLLGTPVYWYGPTALMKAFLDRFVYFNCPENRPGMRGKPVALVIPFEEETPSTAELVVALFERSMAYLEADLIGQVLAPGVGERGAVATRRDLLERAADLGRRLAERAGIPAPGP